MWWWEDLFTLINEATERGMYALVDWHQLDPGDPNYNLANAKRFFTDIANAHKNKNNISIIIHMIYLLLLNNKMN